MSSALLVSRTAFDENAFRIHLYAKVRALKSRPQRRLTRILAGAYRAFEQRMARRSAPAATSAGRLLPCFANISMNRGQDILPLIHSSTQRWQYETPLAQRPCRPPRLSCACVCQWRRRQYPFVRAQAGRLGVRQLRELKSGAIVLRYSSLVQANAQTVSSSMTPLGRILDERCRRGRSGRSGALWSSCSSRRSTRSCWRRWRWRCWGRWSEQSR